MLIDKEGFLDYIITQIPIADKDEIDVGYVKIIAGDMNKDGIVELRRLDGSIYSI